MKKRMQKHQHGMRYRLAHHEIPVGHAKSLFAISQMKLVICILIFLLQGCSTSAITPAELSKEQCKDYYLHYSMFPVSKPDLQHGLDQFAKMIDDRPEMLAFVSLGDLVHGWITRQFAGQGTGYRMYWENLPPSNGADGENRFDDQIGTGAIRVRHVNTNGAIRDSELQLAAVAYELINSRSVPLLKMAWKEAIAKKMSKKKMGGSKHKTRI